MKKLLPLLFYTLLAGISCESTQQPATAPKAGEAETADVAPEPANDISFSIKANTRSEDEYGIPSTEIFINSDVFPDPVFLVNDLTYNEIDKKLWGTYEIPDNAVFAFNSWYAGGGYFYYGTTDGKTLKVFRKMEDEGDPDSKEPIQPAPYELFREIDLKNPPVLQSYYICYKADNNPDLQISIGYDEEGKAAEVLYKGQSETMDLVFKKEDYQEGGAYPTITQFYLEMHQGKENGTYELTHSGNWDYAKYTRGRDGKVFQFTIDHEQSVDGDGYRKTPCF